MAAENDPSPDVSDVPKDRPDEVDPEIVLDEDDFKRVVYQIINEVQFEATSGALPPPTMLKDYDRVLPGSADRIFQRFEDLTAHRILNETKLTDSKIGLAKSGQLLGFASSLIFGGLGLTIALTVDPWAGVAFGGAGVAPGIAGLFIGGRKRRVARTKPPQPAPQSEGEEPLLSSSPQNSG